MKNLWVSLSGAIAQQKNVETIANNIANANTPGFKKDRLVFKEHLAIFDQGVSDIDLPRKEWAPEDFYRSYGAEDAHVKVEASFTDHSQGQLVPTAGPLDVALRGEGFFEILTPNGIRFTRKGIFSLDSEGRLVNDSGHLVLGPPVPIENRENPNNLTPTTERVIRIGKKGKVSINMAGEIFTNNSKIGQLSIREFNDLHALRKEGNSFFINKYASNVKKSENTKTTAHQGFVEESNVNAVLEMSNLIKANRHFESIQRAIKAYDNITGKGVNELARF